MENKKTKIKICGITAETEIDVLVECQVDFAGFVIFFEKSKRNLTTERARELVTYLHANSEIKAVAVVVSPTADEVKQIEKVGFDFIQIHKAVSKEAVDAVTIPMIRAIAVGDDGIVLDEAADKAVALLFDAKEPGSGSAFDWNALADFNRGDKKLFLAGGIHAGNVHQGIMAVRPDVVDISSGVEYNKERIGKDPEKIREFVRKVREYE